MNIENKRYIDIGQSRMVWKVIEIAVLPVLLIYAGVELFKKVGKRLRFSDKVKKE